MASAITTLSNKRPPTKRENLGNIKTLKFHILSFNFCRRNIPHTKSVYLIIPNVYGQPFLHNFVDSCTHVV